MDYGKVGFVLGCVIVAAAFIAALYYLYLAYEQERDLKRMEIERGYKCCEHCDYETPIWSEMTYGETHPYDAHPKPCNEPGFCRGKELV
jgi:hypothetical protein